MWKHAWLFGLFAAVAACSDIPGKDDPRSTIEWGSANPDAAVDARVLANGTCTGQILTCTARPSTACGSDCMDGPACASPYHDECTSYGTNASTCAGDANCLFNGYTCQGIGDAECGADLDETECANDSMGCAWGNTCTGQSAQCRDATDASGCAALPGCTWTPPG